MPKWRFVVHGPHAEGRSYGALRGGDCSTRSIQNTNRAISNTCIFSKKFGDLSDLLLVVTRNSEVVRAAIYDNRFELRTKDSQR